MRIAFDLDNTLIRDQYPFPLEVQSNRWFFKLLGFEPLRKNTIQLMRLLQQKGYEIWIYTASLRDLVYLRLLFRWHGIVLGGIVNQTIHLQEVKKRCCKYPPAFDIDLLIDDSRGVEVEARKYHFDMIRVMPEDDNWHLKVIEKVRVLENSGNPTNEVTDTILKKDSVCLTSKIHQGFSMAPKWQPTALLETLRHRARLYNDIRQFFAARQVLEVETPILSAGCVPDPMIEPLYTHYHCPNSKRLFLHTSPELAMKRLLAAGYGAIFQIGKVFRDGEAGRWHSPEFSLLEWYRPGFNQDDLIQEVDELLQTLLHCPAAERLTYCAVFEQYTGLHPLHSSLSALQDYAAQFGIQDRHQLERDTCLQLILSHHIEPHLGQNGPTVIMDFPASQAALARKRADNPHLAERFEVYLQGIELANGFYELADPIEQRQRFEQDLAKRKALNLPTYPLDERFLAALESGLPDCAGVALGLDRLLMLIAGASHIHEVLAFPVEMEYNE